MSSRPKPAFETSCVERFLDYVKIDTQSKEESDSYPSTEKQFVLLRKLVDELRALGLEDAAVDDYGYVFATVPATTKKAGVPTVGFLAHVDTSPEMPGDGVKPVLHERYDGGDLVLPDDPGAVIKAAENPELAEQVGNTIITASGTTLLGADNKAGVAEIVGAVEYLLAHPEIPHGPIRVGFTPDEEVGRGTEHFDVPRFGAEVAYTMDGSSLGELEIETFSADVVTVAFQGFNTHPGYAKGKMVNAIKVAADFVHRLPKDGLSPETTEGYEGYVHPYVVDASVERTAIRVLLRDFNTPGLRDKEALLRKLADETVAAHPGSSVKVEVVEQYRNMREVLDDHPEAVENAREALRRIGLESIERPIRGGTDGSRLCFMGLPTPNLFAGEHNFHSRYEWVSTYDMHKAVELIVMLARVWEEKAPA